MVSKPKACKYGCGTIITWNESQRFFQGPDAQKHDCRDWPGVGNGGAGSTTTGPMVSGNNANSYTGNLSGGGVYSTAPTTGETLIGVQAKKTWENYFKMLEPLTANSAAIVSLLEESNQHLVDITKQLKEIEDTITVQRIRSGGSSSSTKTEEGEEKKENGA